MWERRACGLTTTLNLVERVQRLEFRCRNSLFQLVHLMSFSAPLIHFVVFSTTCAFVGMHHSPSRNHHLSREGPSCRFLHPDSPFSPSDRRKYTTPTEELKTLQVEHVELCPHTLERARKAEDEIQIIEESTIMRLEERAQGKARAVERAKRQCAYLFSTARLC
jgi:hypothetical protein